MYLYIERYVCMCEEILTKITLMIVHFYSHNFNIRFISFFYSHKLIISMYENLQAKTSSP